MIVVFLRDAAKQTLSYDCVGASLTAPPEGWTVDHNRIEIGSGIADFERGKRAVREWKMFDLGWVELHPANAPIEVGTTVAVLVHHLGFYSLNAARIVYVIDEPDRFGFAYGTLDDHGESGEERFSVEYDRESGEVWYDILAFSKPAHPLAQIGYPIARFFQSSFARDSKSAMLRATGV